VARREFAGGRGDREFFLGVSLIFILGGLWFSFVFWSWEPALLFVPGVTNALYAFGVGVPARHTREDDDAAQK
jgi:hypothetical protein